MLLDAVKHFPSDEMVLYDLSCVCLFARQGRGMPPAQGCRSCLRVDLRTTRNQQLHDLNVTYFGGNTQRPLAAVAASIRVSSRSNQGLDERLVGPRTSGTIDRRVTIVLRQFDVHARLEDSAQGASVAAPALCKRATRLLPARSHPRRSLGVS